jgi:hypothetical protein
LETCQDVLALTGFLLWRQYWRHFWGNFYTGAYLPQKMDLLPPLERERNSVQKHMSSYQVKISEGCFVLAAPTALRGGPYLIVEQQLFEYSREVQRFEPGTCKSARRGAKSVVARVIFILYT